MPSELILSKLNGLTGEVHIPGDKSISHRSIMFGALASGQTKVRNFLLGDDCLSTIDCFKKLGVHIEQQNDEIIIEGKGFDGLIEPTDILDTGNSGTTTRLLLGILSGRPFHSCIIGDESIAKRPMSRVTIPLKQMDANIDGRENGQYTPLSVRGGQLKGIEYTMPVASAQVKSAILFAGLQAPGKTTINEPSKSRDHTERMIQLFGGSIEVNGNTVTVEGEQQLKGANVFVPGDISSAAFFLVGASIIPGSSIKLKNVGLNPTRIGILEVLEQMGASIEILDRSKTIEPFGDIHVKTSALKGTTIDGDLIPRLIDEIPIIALMATQAEGTTVIKNAEELKVKETNRIDTVVNELSKLGAKIEATNDGMIIYGRTPLKGGSVVDSHGDHRIGMMLAIAAAICEEPITLNGASAISVSYPNFFQHISQLTQ